MSYITPITWVGTTVVTVAQLNEQIRDNMDYVHTNLGYADGYVISSVNVGSVTSYTLASIPATYTHLAARGYDMKALSGAGDQFLRMTFNGDTGNNYSGGLYGVVVNTNAAVLTGNDNVAYLNVLVGASTASNRLAVFESRILNYAGTANHRFVEGRFASRYQVGGQGGVWMSVGTAITSITYALSTGGTFTGNIALYGFNS